MRAGEERKHIVMPEVLNPTIKSPNAATAEKPAEQKVKPLIDVIGTSKEDCFAYLDDAALDRKSKPESAKAMRLAVFRYIMDTVKLDGEIRKQAWKQFNATPTWFGTNASAGRQARGTPSALDAAMEDYDA